ncbi:MAG: hypothetical protein HGA22_11290, partial [Clostridiales bacterium]|nr:hypothetical protein [Clostridiales bacterium]
CDGSIITGGEISAGEVTDLMVVDYKGIGGGVYVEGGDSRVVVNNAVMALSGTGKGVCSPSCGVAVSDHGDLTVNNAVIDTAGKSRFCSVVEKYGTLRVNDSVLYAHGEPHGEGYAPATGLMQTPPPALEIGGNCRTHCSMSNSYSYFNNSKIICDGWGALSTEVAEGFVYLEANDCEVIATKKGYGSYADPDCHVFFNNCRFDVDGMAGIIAGEGEMIFTDCDSKCATYFALMHNVNGAPEEVSTLVVDGGRIIAGNDVVLVKSENTQIEFDNVEIIAENKVLVHSIKNDDPCATVPSERPYGVNVVFSNMNVEGNLVHEDPERAMWISLEAVTYKGTIFNGNLSMDMASKWTATGDSTVTLTADIYPAQIDAVNGVTIIAQGAEEAEYRLASGGRLVVKA